MSILLTIDVVFKEAATSQCVTGSVSVRFLENVNMNAEEENTYAEEARKIARKKEIRMPSREPYEEHMQTHMPYRSWCPFCAQRKMVANPKKRAADDEEPEVHIMSWDCMKQRSRETKYAEDGLEPKTMVRFDRRQKWMIAEVAPSEGMNAYAIKVLSEEIDKSGCSRITTMSDQEPALLAFLRAEKNERSEYIEISSDCSPVGDSQSNGAGERAIRTARAQARTMKMALESRIWSPDNGGK